MANTIHFSEAHKKSLLEGFQNKSETESLFSHELDVEFSGVRTVHVKSLKTEALQDYNRAKSVDSGSRYGATVEVGDEEQTFTMTQDKSLSLSIDKGNNAEQFNMKKAGAVMKAERDEVIVPAIDTYRIGKWATDAGIHKALAAKTDKTNIVSQIIELKNEMLDAGVPETGLTLLIKREYIPALKLSSEWTALDSLGGKSLPSGTIGEVDGMAVKPVTNSRFPANAAFMILHKGAAISPVKINTFKGHIDPPGLSGDLLEFRIMYDAFVLGKRAAGVAVGCLPSTVAAAPTATYGSGKVTLASTDSGTIYYTTDGSDPRYSVEAKAYTAAVAAAAGDVVRAYVKKDGLWNSSVLTYTVG
jgi:hypothetical protein